MIAKYNSGFCSELFFKQKILESKITTIPASQNTQKLSDHRVDGFY